MDCKIFDYKTITNELMKRVGYRERQKLVLGNSNDVTKIQDGLYSFRGIKFTFGMQGYEDYTIIDG